MRILIAICLVQALLGTAVAGTFGQHMQPAVRDSKPPMTSIVRPVACRYESYWVAQCKRECRPEQIYQGGTWVYVTKCVDIGCWQQRRICD